MNKPSHKISLFFTFTMAMMFVLAQTCFGQDKASEWVQRGLKATNPDSRIAAFERAIQIEPDYVEAYFYLGLAYKQKNMLSEAELAFHKAYFKNPYALNNEIKTRILFELGIVKSNLGKTVEALDSFKSAKAIAGNNSTLKGRIQYELGLAYINNGDYQLALKELREGRELIPQSSALFNKAITEAESNMNILNNYNDGLSLLNNGKYQQAIQKFEVVAQQNADFKDVQTKLSEAKRNLNQSNTTKRINEVYQQALSAKQKNDNQLALKLFQEVANDDPNFRDVENELRQLRNAQQPAAPARRETENNKNDNLERLYAKGRNDLANKNLTSAINAFRQVNAIRSNYKDTADLLADAQNQLNRQTAIEKQLAALYEEGLDLLAGKDWKNALTRFKKVQEIRPGYREVEQKMRDLRQAIADEKRMLVAIDSLYQKGMQFTKSENWLQALLAFEKVDALHPGYRDSKERLLEAKRHFEDMESKPDPGKKETNIILIAGVVFIVVIIPFAGVLIFSPTLKARMYLIKGDYNKAALLLEQILQKRPEKVKLYPLLAHIYLLEDRQDETALKTYEMILKLNIMTPKRAQINSIVANHYLKSGKRDSNALNIMEKELSYKMKKLQSGTAN